MYVNLTGLQCSKLKRMIDTEQFLDGLIKESFTDLCVVPCSFATSLINACINKSDKINYIPCASEGVACSIATGLKLSGKNPIIIVQSSGLTNLGSCLTSLVKPYKINLTIIVSWRTYKNGQSEIQHSHLATNIKGLIKSYGYKSEILDTSKLNNAIAQVKNSSKKSKILLLKKDSFTKVQLNDKHKIDLSELPKRSEYLKYLNLKSKNRNSVFIGTTGNAAREMYTYMHDTKNFYMAGNMGGALSLGLGSALAGKNTIVCGGDAEFVMHLGGLTTAGRYQHIDANLLYIVFDNFSNKSTGGQRSYQEHLNYIMIAKSSGFNAFEEIISSMDKFDIAFKESSKHNLYFMHVRCSYDEITPRPPAKAIIESKTSFAK